MMSAGLISLSAGILIGLLYGLLKVRSPAPPALALVGLLGMLAGESLMGQVLQPEQTANTRLCQTPPGTAASSTVTCPAKGD